MQLLLIACGALAERDACPADRLPVYEEGAPRLLLFRCASRRSCSEPCVEAEGEAGTGFFIAEDVGSFQLGDAVKERPERDRRIIGPAFSREPGYMLDDEPPEEFMRIRFFAVGVAGKQEQFVKVRVFAGEGEVSAGYATDGLLRRGPVLGPPHGRVEKTGGFARERRFKNRAIGEVTIEGVGRETERARESAQGERAKAPSFDLFDGRGEDRLPVGSGGVGHGYHCTS